MSTDRISAAPAAATKKRKATQEDVGFPPSLKPIITACKPRLLLCTEDSTKDCKDCSRVDLDVTRTGNYDDNNNVEGIEGCKTPKGEEHHIPNILSCPPAPRKPRPIAKRKLGDYFYVNPADLNLLFNLSSQSKKFKIR